MKIGLLPFLLLVLQVSCITQEICDDDSQSELVARFKTIESTITSDTIMSDVSIHGIREGQSDSLLYDSVSTSIILLPLDPNLEQSRFVLNMNKQNDTLVVTHRNEVYLISYTCGFATLFNLENIGYTSLMIKDIEIKDSIVDTELLQDEEHIWIYY
ncbi:MAG: hypothetical protein KAR19_14190 [Bacteroidales bacterium]|nr:hypothetical protein [Bacteroidales bacterium]